MHFTRDLSLVQNSSSALLVENPEDNFSHLTTQLNYVFGGWGWGVICHILFYVIIMIGPLHDKTSNFCLQLIMHKSKFNVYPHELENDHIHKKAKHIHMSCTFNLKIE